MSLFLALWNSKPFRRLKIEDIDLESRVEDLRGQVIKALGEKEANTIVLTFCGTILEDGVLLSSYGITSGVTLHAIDKIDDPQPPMPRRITEADVQEIVSCFRNFRSTPGFRSTLHRLESPEEVDKVISAVPGLEDDPVAIAFLSKPDIILQMEDPKSVWKIGNRHPLLLEAARYIATEFHGTTIHSSASNAELPSTSSGFSYSLDALSDDDETMDDTTQGAITVAHLAAALAQAAEAARGQPGGSGATGFGGVTADMLQQALPGAQYTEQLRRMRELGLTDDTRNSRALALTQGDVQAAVDIVFSGALDD